jgi:hypothetical protein
MRSTQLRRRPAVETEDTILALDAQGLNAVQIAPRVKRPASHVRAVLKKNGISRGFVDWDVYGDVVKQRYADGESADTISAALREFDVWGPAPSSIEKYLKAERVWRSFRKQDVMEAQDDLYIGGKTLASCAADAGVAVSTYMAHLRKKGLLGQGGRAANVEENKAQVLRLWQEGKTASECNKILKGNYYQTKQWIEESGLSGGKQILIKAEVDLMVARYDEGVSVEQVANEFDRSYDWSSRKIRERRGGLRGPDHSPEVQKRRADLAGLVNRQMAQDRPVEFLVCLAYQINPESCLSKGDQGVFEVKWADRKSRKIYCCRECFQKNRVDPEKKVFVRCQNPSCPRPSELIETWAAHPKKYHDRRCTRQGGVRSTIAGVQYDSDLEPSFARACRVRNLVVERFDDGQALHWTDEFGSEHDYGPDFKVILNSRPVWVETKGAPSVADLAKWDAWRKYRPRQPLIILYEDDVDALCSMSDARSFREFLESRVSGVTAGEASPPEPPQVV